LKMMHFHVHLRLELEFMSVMFNVFDILVFDILGDNRRFRQFFFSI